MDHLGSFEVAGELRAGAVCGADGVVLGFADGRLERWEGGRPARVAASGEAWGSVIAVRVAAMRVAVLYDRRLVVRDLASLEELASWSLGALLDGVPPAKPTRLWDRTRPLALGLSPDGTRAIVGTASNPSHHVMHLGTGEVLFAGSFIEFEEACNAAVFSPDGKTFAAGAFADGDYYVDVCIYRAADFELLAVASYHCLHVSDLAYSHDGRRLARASREFNLSGDGEGLVVLDVPDAPVDLVRLYPQHAIEDHEGYDADAGRPFWGHEVDVMYHGVRFASDGRLVALCGDGQVRLFDTQELAHLAVSPGAYALDGDGTRFVVFSPRRVDVLMVR
jgi:WD40 repeat protein